MGSGRTELAMAAFGRAYGSKISGTVIMDGEVLELTSIPEAIAAGISYVTEDRKESGLLLNSTITHNITLPRMDYVSQKGRIDQDLERRIAEEYRQALDIRAPNVDRLAGNLSGGNQQKLLLGKWIYSKPDVLFLDEPTRGVDVGAKYEIYQIINELAEEGKSILFISSELNEILGMADRIYVMNEGQIIAEFPGDSVTQEEIMSCIMQHSKGQLAHEQNCNFVSQQPETVYDSLCTAGDYYCLSGSDQGCPFETHERVQSDFPKRLRGDFGSGHAALYSHRRQH